MTDLVWGEGIAKYHIDNFQLFKMLCEISLYIDDDDK